MLKGRVGEGCGKMERGFDGLVKNDI